MNAKKISLVVVASLATSLAAIPFAQAGAHYVKEHQPHPGISERDARQLGICYMVMDSIVPSNVVYVENGPLHPTYSFTRSDTNWVGVGSTISRPDVNSGNPLHPSFKR